MHNALDLAGLMTHARALLPKAGLQEIEDLVLFSTSGRNITRLDLHGKPRTSIPFDSKVKLDQALEERVRGVPLQYITGVQRFLDYDFVVKPGVLIPRPETETLVLTAAEALEAAPPNSKGIEVGVGSGVVSISLLSRLPCLSMEANDISSVALDVAKENAFRVLGSGCERLQLIRSGGLEFSNPPYDFLISNPPYLDEGEPREFDATVPQREPLEALFPPGRDLFYFYRLFARQVGRVLRAEGRVFLEVPHERAREIAELFSDEGWETSLVLDLTGRPRVLIAKGCPR